MKNWCKDLRLAKWFTWNILAQLVVVLNLETGFSTELVPQSIFPLAIPRRQAGFPLSGPTNVYGMTGWGYNGRPSAIQNPNSVVAIAVGFWHNLALRSDGTLVGWAGGLNQALPVCIPDGLSNIVNIAAGFNAGLNYSVALRSDGKAFAWTEQAVQANCDHDSFISLPPSLSNLVVIGSDLAIRQDGVVVNLMNGSTTPITNGLAVSRRLILTEEGKVISISGSVPIGLSNIVAVSSGDSHYLALRSDGTVIAWGDNGAGQINVPVDVTNAVAIAAGAAHSLALLSDGRVVAWGANTYGAINIPADLNGGSAIAAGGYNSLCLYQTAPSIVGDLVPATVRVPRGGMFSFTVPAIGGGLYFKWHKNGAELPGQIRPTLTVSNVAPSDAGRYSAVVSNPLGEAVSSEAQVLVREFGAPVAWVDGIEVLFSATNDSSALLNLTTEFPDGYIFYTLDGSVPTFTSPLFQGSVRITNDTTVRALALRYNFSEVQESTPVQIFIRGRTVELIGSPVGSAVINPDLALFPLNSTATLTATATPGWSFVRWQGDVYSTNNPLNLIITQSMRIQPVFGTRIFTSVIGSVVIESEGPSIVEYGTAVPLRAVPNPGHAFAVWGGDLLGTNNPTTFIVTHAMPRIAALFGSTTTGVPTFFVQPQSQTVLLEGNVTLNVNVIGAGPIGCEMAQAPTTPSRRGRAVSENKVSFVR